VDTVVCAPDDGWKYHPKHVEQFPDINKLYNVASCWIYVGILLGAHPILHISRIRVKTELIDCPERSVTCYQSTSCNILEEQNPQFYCDGRLLEILQRRHVHQKWHSISARQDGFTPEKTKALCWPYTRRVQTETELFK
jgi:hypothetical protein